MTSDEPLAIVQNGDMSKRKKVAACSECGTAIYLTHEQIYKLAGQLARKARKSAAAGPPAVVKPCVFCGKAFNATNMRIHIPRCPKRPNKTSGRPTDPELDKKHVEAMKKKPVKKVV